MNAALMLYYCFDFESSQSQCRGMRDLQQCRVVVSIGELYQLEMQVFRGVVTRFQLKFEFQITSVARSFSLVPSVSSFQCLFQQFASAMAPMQLVFA